MQYYYVLLTIVTFTNLFLHARLLLLSIYCIVLYCIVKNKIKNKQKLYDRQDRPTRKPDCRVLSISDCRYSLNPLSQTRIDLNRTLSNTVDVQTELCLAFMVSIRRIVTYNIFINKQLQHINGYK